MSVEATNSEYWRRKSGDNEIKERVAAEVRDFRLKTGITMEEFMEAFGEQKAAMHKIESGANHISLIKYLMLVKISRGAFPEHPALPLVKAISHDALEALAKRDTLQVRLIDYLKSIELTRHLTPRHPALPLIDHILYSN